MGFNARTKNLVTSVPPARMRGTLLLNTASVAALTAGLLVATAPAYAQTPSQTQTKGPAAPQTTVGADQNIGPGNAAASQAGDLAGAADIVVTAQRRSQTLQDIPYNISVVNPAAIAASGATTIDNLTRLVPGLTSVDQGSAARGGTNNLTLRGLRTGSPGGGNNPAEVPGQSISPVSTYFGETPVFFPIPLYDIERVEVLRGPQGTLYGSGAQAGTIRIIPQRPKFDKISGSIEATGALTEHSREKTYGVNAALNLPLSDTFAVRLVGGARREGGFIDAVDLFKVSPSGVPVPSVPGDLTSGPVLAPVDRDTNTTKQWFGRAALRWKPTESLDIQIDYLHQHIKADDAQLSNPGYAGGPLDLTTPLPADPDPVTNPPAYPNSTFTLRPGGDYRTTAFIKRPYEDNLDLVSGLASLDLGFATVTSTSSYYDDKSVATADYTSLFYRPGEAFNYNAYPPYNFYPRLLPIAPTVVGTDSFIQEVRLVSKASRTFEYVIGGFYQRQHSNFSYVEVLPGFDAYSAAIGQPSPAFLPTSPTTADQRNRFTDLAAFGELTGHVTDKWQITGGFRLFRQTFRSATDYRFPLLGASVATDGVDPTGLTQVGANYKVTKLIKKVNTSYDVSRNLKFYATYSEGFRRGGANSLPTVGPFASLPVYQTYAPDIAKNFEIGIKGSLANRRVSYAVDVYRINLNRFQLQTATAAGGFPVTLNGDKARSQGVEAETQVVLAHGLNATLGYAYTDAKVTRNFDRLDYQAYGSPGYGGTGELVSILGGGLEKGTRLPGVPKHTASASLDWAIELGGGLFTRITPHIDGSYRSAAAGFIVPDSSFNWRIPGFFNGDARVTFDLKNKVTFDLFVNNFTDEQGFSGGQGTQSFPNYSRLRNVSRPRTFGVTLRYTYE